VAGEIQQMDNSHILKEILVQIIGFGVVFLVLKKFAWNNMLGMIDMRRKTIEDEFASIERKKKDLENLEKEYRGRLEHVEQEAREKIQEASKIGQQLSKDIQEGARLDAKRLFERTQADIEQEIAKARVSMRDEIVEISSLMTEKILREKLDSREHEKLVDKFLKELEKEGVG
jgi:F-type H+-transporting ATPase subunit b